MQGKHKEYMAAEQPPEEKPTPILWFLWGTLTGSLCAYALAGILIQSISSRPLVPEDLSVLIPIFGSMALAMTVAIFACAPTLAKQTTYQLYSLTRWILADVVGVIGFALFFLGASWGIFAAFLGWALLLELYLRPTPEAQDQFLRLARHNCEQRMPQAPFPRTL